MPAPPRKKQKMQEHPQDGHATGGLGVEAPHGSAQSSAQNASTSSAALDKSFSRQPAIIFTPWRSRAKLLQVRTWLFPSREGWQSPNDSVNTAAAFDDSPASNEGRNITQIRANEWWMSAEGSEIDAAGEHKDKEEAEQETGAAKGQSGARTDSHASSNGLHGKRKTFKSCKAYATRRKLLRLACDVINAWKVRSPSLLPHAVESTWHLVDAVLSDSFLEPGRSNALTNPQRVSVVPMKASYITAITRFVTATLDSAQMSKFKVSMYVKAAEIGLPAMFVDLRHESTHGETPSLGMLREATNEALQWLWSQYWRDLGDIGSVAAEHPIGDPADPGAGIAEAVPSYLRRMEATVQSETDVLQDDADFQQYHSPGSDQADIEPWTARDLSARKQGIGVT